MLAPPKKLLVAALHIAFFSSSSVFAQDLVTDDLITGSNTTTPWLECDSDSNVVDVTQLDAGLCAFRTTEAQAGVPYRMSCGATIAKYASITLAFQDDQSNTLATRTTELADHTSGVLTVDLVAPAGTTTAAIGIYGETGSGFQDCVLLDATPAPEPTKGSIAGTSWFDENGDSSLDAAESRIANTGVTLLSGNTVLAQTQTDTDGVYYFGNLDVNQCYTVEFTEADSSLQFANTGGDHDVVANGQTGLVCLSDNTPNVANIDTGFVAIPPVAEPADYALCGTAWIDANGNGIFDGSDSVRPGVTVNLLDSNGVQISTLETDHNGNYVYPSLASGDYAIQFHTPELHEATIGSGQPQLGASVISSQGLTGTFSLPGDSNTAEGSACTIANINGGFVPTVESLEPTVANDDYVSGEVGASLSVDLLANDALCDGSIDTVDIIGHNVPGVVTYNAQLQRMEISNTTATGTYSIEYGARGGCGSYDTANILIEITEVVPPVVAASVEAPVCRVETGGSTINGGVDVFDQDEFGFVSNYNLYDRDQNLVISVSSDDISHKYFRNIDIVQVSGHTSGGEWEIEWIGSQYGFDQVSIHYVSAVENGVESALTQCERTLISPIALDLDNQGRIERLAGDFSVDMDGDGVSEPLSQWFAPSAGILVTADASGQITGNELFGNVVGKYSDGFEKLALLDSDENGSLTGDELQSLAIWVDLNSDTKVDDDELSTLTAHQIVALPVEHYKYMARATRANGKDVLMEDVWFPLAPMASAR